MIQADQISLFDGRDNSPLVEKEETQNLISSTVVSTPSTLRFSSYTHELYFQDIDEYGLEKTWDALCEFLLSADKIPVILSEENIGGLYEKGLEYQDKNRKKSSGQYFTPDDVALVMSEWLFESAGENVCDVACGTGKLILTYLSFIGREAAVSLISSGKVFLYDIDPIALKICVTSIMLRYGADTASHLNVVCRDFLDREVLLPKNAKVIANPPYASFSEVKDSWERTAVVSESREHYAAFMEKVFSLSVSTVIISPYSFISGKKFFSLRKMMSNFSGFIVSFDNVPGNIFNGKKKGIFNSNTSNSVRAAITVLKKNGDENGFCLTPLIRFKSIEREQLLRCDVLERFLNPRVQKVDEKNREFYKCDKRLDPIFQKWREKSGKTLGDYIRKDGVFNLCVPNTCRYFTCAGAAALNRSGQHRLSFDDEDVFNFIYCVMNSSFAYWYWRMYDGGITYSKGLLLSLPVFFEELSDDDKAFFRATAEEMIRKSDGFIVKKKNVGSQENIKFPREYRDRINRRLLSVLDVSEDERIFDIVHSNMALEVNV